jgi:hypothetical protein
MPNVPNTPAAARLRVLGEVIVSYLVGFIPILFSGVSGVWWAKIL